MDALNTAIEDYRSRKATFMSGENAQLTNPDAQLGESAPVWIPDQRVTMCQVHNLSFLKSKLLEVLEYLSVKHFAKRKFRRNHLYILTEDLLTFTK